MTINDIIACNCFGFKELRSSHWACGYSSFHLLPFSSPVWAGIKDVLGITLKPTHQKSFTSLAKCSILIML